MTTNRTLVIHFKSGSYISIQGSFSFTEDGDTVTVSSTDCNINLNFEGVQHKTVSHYQNRVIKGVVVEYIPKDEYKEWIKSFE